LRYDILSLGDPCAQLAATARRAECFIIKGLIRCRASLLFFGFNLGAGKTDTNV